MANNENKSTLMHDAIMLFVITIIAGVLLGGVYTITKGPIAAADEKATNEAYAAVYKDAEFKADDTLTKAVESFQKDVAAGKIDDDTFSYTTEELIEARTASKDGSHPPRPDRNQRRCAFCGWHSKSEDFPVPAASWPE